MKKLATLLTSLILAFGLVGLVYAQQMGGRVGNQMSQEFFYQSSAQGVSMVSGFNTLTVPNFVATTATITGISSGDLLPSANNTYYLGSATYGWKGGYFSDGSAGAPSITFASDTDTGLYRYGNNVPAIAGGGATRMLFATSYIDSYDDFFPHTNNTYDLGSATNAWKDIYASGTAYISKVGAGAGVAGTPSFTFANDANTGAYSEGDFFSISAGGSRRASFGSTIYLDVDTVPTSDNARDLGSTTYTWAESHVQDAYVYDTLTTGQFKFEEDAGFPTWADMSVSATPAVGTQMSYTAKIDGEYFLKLYSEADSSGGIQNKSINMYPDTLKLGKRDVTSYIYVGTADGCGVWEFSSSSTSPTLTPTSTSFCN